MSDPVAHFPPKQKSLPIHCWLKITSNFYMTDLKQITTPHKNWQKASFRKKRFLAQHRLTKGSGGAKQKRTRHKKEIWHTRVRRRIATETCFEANTLMHIFFWYQVDRLVALLSRAVESRQPPSQNVHLPNRKKHFSTPAFTFPHVFTTTCRTALESSGASAGLPAPYDIS